MYLQLFLTFFRIGILTFGGGYTVLPLLQKETVEKKQWISQLEVIDYYAVGQCLPGMIGVNTAILIGYKVKGKGGSVAAAAGFSMPSLLIILAIASLIQNVAGLPVVQSAFAGIRVAVCALVVNAIYTMAQKAIINPITAVLALAVFIAAVWLQVSPVPLVIVAAAAGLILSVREGKLGRKTNAAPTGGGDKAADEDSQAGEGQ
ncbi:MAG: chromate transporter [Clostridiales bacterium]|nr:chromate transporter [Clostridiales bacterium]